MPAPRHVLLARTDHLGDMLLTLPAAAAVKAAYPTCRVTVLASAANAEAARHHPAVDAVVVDARAAQGSGLRGLRAIVGQIRALGCDAAVLARPTPRLAVAVRVAGVPIRIGTAYRAYSFLFNRRVREHRRRPPWQHETQYTLNLLRPLGIVAAAPARLHWEVRPAELAQIDELLRQRGLRHHRMVAIHPGSAGSSLNWPAPSYVEFGRRLADPSLRIVVTGSHQEAALTGTVATGIGQGAVDFGGAVTLPLLAALLHRSALYVGSSTGPTHLAAAVGTPVLALYSPLRSASPQRWGPLGTRVAVLRPNVDITCPKCLGSRCPYYHCMERHLTVEAAVATATRLLNSGRSD